MIKYGIALLMLLVPIVMVGAYTAPNSTFGASANSCIQSDPHNISCANGEPVIADLYLTPEIYYSGAYTVIYITNGTVRALYTPSGQICTISGSSTAVCQVNLLEFPILLGTGTARFNISIGLVPINKSTPNIYYNYPIAVNHYQNGADSVAVNFYNQTNFTYTKMRTDYSYACFQYEYCNNTIANIIYESGPYLSNALVNLESDNTEAAYYNETFASVDLSESFGEFSNYLNASNKVIANVTAGRTALQNVTHYYGVIGGRLNSCDSTTASKINYTIHYLDNYSTSSVESASNYSRTALTLQNNLSNTIAYCHINQNLVFASNNTKNQTTSTSSNTVKSSSGQGLSLFGISPIFFIIGIALIAVIFTILRIREQKTIEEIRSDDV